MSESPTHMAHSCVMNPYLPPGLGGFFKSLLNLLQYCFCFLFGLFGLKHVRSQFPDQGLNLYPLALENKVLTTGPGGISAGLGVLEVRVCVFYQLWHPQYLVQYLAFRMGVLDTSETGEGRGGAWSSYGYH